MSYGASLLGHRARPTLLINGTIVEVWRRWVWRQTATAPDADTCCCVGGRGSRGIKVDRRHDHGRIGLRAQLVLQGCIAEAATGSGDTAGGSSGVVVG